MPLVSSPEALPELPTQEKEIDFFTLETKYPNYGTYPPRPTFKFDVEEAKKTAAKITKTSPGLQQTTGGDMVVQTMSPEVAPVENRITDYRRLAESLLAKLI